ncbi:hypothetical protein [Thalassotalea aquiviva]|uniref:hypothetical protein n=1 Tax=Thalassotalea aquiviva TaxID=3242415 RepID=UPI00352B0D91
MKSINKQFNSSNPLFYGFVYTIFLLFFFSASTQAGKPTPIDVQSKITIFDSQQCVRERSTLSSLTCTANDVRLADITLGSGASGECTAGEDVTQNLNFRVISTANIRYNWSFYTTLDSTATPLEGPGNVCSIWVGEIIGDGANSQSVNGDVCTDVTKSQPAEFIDQALTFKCQDTDGDGFVDLPYCATWSQSDDDLCTTDNIGDIDPNSLPVPGSPSKCNCEDIAIPVLVKPAAPTLVKAPLQVSRTEAQIYAGTDTFEFDLKITNPNESAPIIITEITDIFDLQPYVIPTNINTTPNLIVNEDEVYLVSATDSSGGTCLSNGPITIAGGEHYICKVTFRWKSLDLYDTDGNFDNGVKEDKVNSFKVKWKSTNQVSEIEETGPSNNAIASITDVAPILTLSKSVSPTSINETGEPSFDLVTYTLTFGNDSGWDTINISDENLADVLLQNGLAPQNIDLSQCDISNLIVGEANKVDCVYSVNLASVYPSLNAGDIYKNTATATPTDEEGSNGAQKTAMATVDVNNVSPMVTLKKYVRAGQSLSTNVADYNDVSTLVGEFELNDLTNAPKVTYLFVVTNNSFEPFTIVDFIDFADDNGQGFSTTPPSSNYDVNIADTTPLYNSCNGLDGSILNTSVPTFDPINPDANKVHCLITFKVKGDDDESVDNTAWVLVDDGDSPQALQDFDTDAAMVDFTPKPISFNLGIGLSAIIEIEVTADENNVEATEFNPFEDIVVLAIPQGSTIPTEVSLLTTDFNKFTISNIDCSDQTQVLIPSDNPVEASYSCRFQASANNASLLDTAVEVIDNSLTIKARDNDGGTPERLSSTITVKKSASMSN